MLDTPERIAHFFRHSQLFPGPATAAKRLLFVVLTLSSARLKFADSAPQDKLVERINSACSTLMTRANPRDLIERVAVTAHYGYLTLNRHYNVCLGMLFQETPIPIRNSWVEFVYGGGGQSVYDDKDSWGGVIDLGDKYCCFVEPKWVDAAGCRIKFYTDAPSGIEKTSVTIEVYGLDVNGIPVRTTATARFGESVSLLGATGSVTTTASFCTLTQIVKQRSKGVISIYAVDPDDSSETLIGRLDPAETTPCYRRYKVPTDPAGTHSYVLIAKCQRRYIEAVDDNDILSVQNEDALRYVLSHLHAQDQKDRDGGAKDLALALLQMSDDARKSNPPAQFPPMVNYVQEGSSGLSAFY